MMMIGGLFIISATLHETFSSYVDQYPPDYEAVSLSDYNDEVYDVNNEEVRSHVLESEYLEDPEYMDDYEVSAELGEDIDEELEYNEVVEFTSLEEDLIIAEEDGVIEIVSSNDDGYDDLGSGDDNNYDAYADEEDCPECPPCDEDEEDCPIEEECPECPPCDEEEEEECPPCPEDCQPSGGKPAPPAGGQPPAAPGAGQSPPTLPQTGVVAGLTGLTILGGSGLLASGLALAKKKSGVKLSVNEILDQEYTEMFEN